MTYYVINNISINQTEYFVPDEETKSTNYHLVCIVGTQEDAIAKNEQNKQEFLEKESYRFTVAKEEVNGNDTTWKAADLTNDAEEGVYHVFNHTNGLYETVNGLSNSIARMNELKQNFIDSLSINVVAIDKLPPKPTKYAQEIYGIDTGSIPVEVM